AAAVAATQRLASRSGGVYIAKEERFTAAPLSAKPLGSADLSAAGLRRKTLLPSRPGTRAGGVTRLAKVVRTPQWVHARWCSDGVSPLCCRTFCFGAVRVDSRQHAGSRHFDVVRTRRVGAR